VSPDSGEPGRPPIPLPDLAQVNAALGETIWNRADGTLFITRDMANRSKCRDRYCHVVEYARVLA
jgi:hypothetical protein